MSLIMKLNIGHFEFDKIKKWYVCENNYGTNEQPDLIVKAIKKWL